MGTNGTYEQLFAIRHDIMMQSAQHPSFQVLNRNRIKAFYNQNQMRLQMLDSKLREIYDAHVAKDDKGQYIKAEDGKDWIYKSDADQADFKMRFNALMRTEVMILY